MASLISSLNTSGALGNTALTHFDFVMIGSGAGGSAAAAILAKNGKRVLILEAGPNYFLNLDHPDPKQVGNAFSNDTLKLTRRNFLIPDPLLEPRTFRHGERDGHRKFVGEFNAMPRTVGGGAVHAGLNLPRFLPQDFRLGSLLGEVPGANFADWPVDYDQLEPFYEYVEENMGVQGQAGLTPFEGPRRKPYPMGPGVPMYVSLKAAQGAEKLGYHPFPYPAGVNSKNFDGRPACVDCGFCNQFGCPTNAKGSPAVTTLRKALLTGNVLLLPETKVIRLQTSSSGREIVGIEALDASGEKKIYQGDQYILSAGTIENVRILLFSDKNGVGVGNQNGLVGRNIMFHLKTYGVGIFSERLHGHRGRTLSHGIADFRGVAGDSSRPLGGIVEFGGGLDPVDEALSYANQMGMSGGLIKALMEQSPFRDRLMVLTMHGEDAPQLSNRVDLDPEVKDIDGVPAGRTTYKNHAFELEAQKHYQPKLLEIVGKAGAKYGISPPRDLMPKTHHLLGTLRMGKNAASSVCDPLGRFHGVGNLLVADGSLLPTSSGFNPTLTIAALAARVGAGLIHPQSPESAL